MNEQLEKTSILNDDFDQFLGNYGDIDSMFNETLTAIQDLDVPTGFNEERSKGSDHHHHKPSIKHSRGISGTAIFGFADHNREWSFSGMGRQLTKGKPSMEAGKGIVPEKLYSSGARQNDSFSRNLGESNLGYSDSKNWLISEKDEDHFLEEKQPTHGSDEKKTTDYIVTTKNPKTYKFPPSPPAAWELKANDGPSEPSYNSNGQVNQLATKYLQDPEGLSFGLPEKTEVPETKYSLDIQPFLEKEEKYANNNQGLFNDDFFKEMESTQELNIFRYVPIPVQDPTNYNDILQQQTKNDTKKLNLDYNNVLLPPTPPNLTNTSPEWTSSPEPPSPSPNRNLGEDNKKLPLFSSPIYEQSKPAFQFVPNTDNNFLTMSSPLQSSQRQLHTNNFFSSPIKGYRQLDNTEFDVNETIAQATPTKSTQNTPLKNKVTLEWSPIISPNFKSSKDVRRAIQQSSPRKMKKTSLLPPGELDRYWVGPDQNRIFTCTYKNCGKKFTRRYNVRSHIQTHLSDRPFGCSYCSKRFVRQHDLNRHVKGHLEARHCKCDCGKEFSRLDALKKHKLRNICIGGFVNSELREEATAD